MTVNAAYHKFMLNKISQTLALNLTFDLQVLRLAIKSSLLCEQICSVFRQLSSLSLYHFYCFLMLRYSNKAKKHLKRLKSSPFKVSNRAFYRNRSTLKRLIYLLLEAFRLHDISNNFNQRERERESPGPKRDEKVFLFRKTQIKFFFIISIAVR